MRILVISILRLGDTLMLAPAIRGLSQKYTNTNIDMLVNTSTEIVSPFFPEVHKFYAIDRKDLQDGLVQISRPLFESFDKLKSLCDDLNKNEYDLIINLTQNKISGYLCGYLKCENKKGLVLDEKGIAQFNSPWFKYLNDVVSAGVESIFHYTDIFYSGLGLPMGDQSLHFKEIQSGQAELVDLLKSANYSSSVKIVIQFLTSDKKKNWPIKSWITAIEQIKLFNSGSQIFLLAAPNEKKEAESLHTQLKSLGIETHLAVMSLEGAFALLNVCDLLITGDTSIKHLATGTNISILELSLGSSDFRKTGCYKPNSIIIKSRETCAPCAHSGDCHRERHFCSASIDPNLVSLVATQYLVNNWSALKILADEYKDKVEVYKTYLSNNGFWGVENLSASKATRTMSQHLDKLAWKLLLQKEHLKPLAEYGTESLRFSQDVMTSMGRQQTQLIRLSIEQMLNFTEITESKTNKLQAELAQRLRNTGLLTDNDFVDSDLKNKIANLECELGLGHFLTEKINMKQNLGLYKARQLQLSLNDIFSHLQIKNKILRTLKTHIMEYQ